MFVGNSNTGKSFLARNLSLSTWTTGMIDRMDSVNPHSYAYAFSAKTCTLIEEPLFTVDNKETYKLVMGGEPMLLNPKNCEPYICDNEGFIIMTCNELPWSRYETLPYENRSYIFKFDKELKLSFHCSVEQFWSAWRMWAQKDLAL